MTGYVHSIQTLGTLDGPGVRCVVFLQGCPLRCSYCHNPDTWQAKTGMVMTVDEVLRRILRCRPYFGAGGGVTLSGGEALLQVDFATALLKKCKENGIHTALDTSGCILNAKIDALLEYCDLCLLDVKATDKKAYQSLCKGSFAQTMLFLQKLQEKNIATWIRHVVVPGLNDTQAHILKLRDILAPYTCIEKTELLPFRSLCALKYKALKIPFLLADTPQMEQPALQKLQALLY